MTALSSKERVKAFLERRIPDRVPRNYSGNPQITKNLMEHFHAADSPALLEALGVDFRGVGAPYRGPVLHPLIEGRRVDPCWGIRTRWVSFGVSGYHDYCDFPLSLEDVDRVMGWPMPDPDDFDYGVVAAACEKYAGYGISCGGAGLPDLINSTGMLFGMEETLIGLATDDEALLAFLDRKLEVTLEVIRRTIEAARGKIDFLWMGEDLGTQTAPIISLELFRRHLRPRHQRVIDLAKHYGLPTLIHTCGSSSWAYPDFIEMGMDGVDTLQPEAARMSPAYLKETFGSRLAFHGCISTQDLAQKGEEEIRSICRNTLETMMPGGGYALSPTHAIQDDTPVANVLAMYEVADEKGRY
jgi:hypothetical protein